MTPEHQQQDRVELSPIDVGSTVATPIASALNLGQMKGPVDVPDALWA